MKKLIMFTLIAGSALANAASLGGHTMDCQYTGQAFGKVTTHMIFLNEGQNEVLVRSSIAGDSVVDYTLAGNTLSIREPGTDRFNRYDLSNPNAVISQRQTCVSPGVPDGDSRPFCEGIAEVCTLK